MKNFFKRIKYTDINKTPLKWNKVQPFLLILWIITGIYNFYLLATAEFYLFRFFDGFCLVSVIVLSVTSLIGLRKFKKISFISLIVVCVVRIVQPIFWIGAYADYGISMDAGTAGKYFGMILSSLLIIYYYYKRRAIFGVGYNNEVLIEADKELFILDENKIVICPNCKKENLGNSRFCSECGTSIPYYKFCTQCGTKLTLSQLYCHRCGSKCSK